MNDTYDFGESAKELRLLAQELAADASYSENIIIEIEGCMHGDNGEDEPLVGMRSSMEERRRRAVIVGQVSELLIDLSPREGEVRKAAGSMRLPLTARAATADERASVSLLRENVMAFLRSQIARFSKLDRWPRSPLRPWRAR